MVLGATALDRLDFYYFRNSNPNPSQNYFTVNLSFEKATDVKLQLINNIGEVVQTRLLQNVIADMYEFDLSAVSNGVYFLRLATNDLVQIKKVVVQK